MTGLGIAIVVHVLAVVWWIGGLAFVTTVFLPAIRHGLGNDPHVAFYKIESRFAPQARIAVILVGVSGLYLLWRLNAWYWLAHIAFWWLDAMILYWVLFALLLFVLEPAGVLKRAMRGAADEAGVWRRMQSLHALMLVIALVIIAGAAVGSHGF